MSASPRRRDSLTSLWFFAAAFVVIGHWGNVVHPLSRLHQLLERSNLGVSFFFVLSGSVLTWSHRPSDTARGFYWRRFARIWPLHASPWPSLLPAYLPHSWNSQWSGACGVRCRAARPSQRQTSC